MSVSERLTAALSGRYRIERELGRGGMATVYLAGDLKHARRVALKVLRPELAAAVGGERFLAEIRTTANLQHPHILPLFDSGEADGFLYYVMPYVEGETLRDRVDREKQLPIEEAIALARKIANALDHAHSKGVVHRDIKPANVLLSERGEPLIADFGIALAVSQAGGGRITETGLSLGTPHYMSPEQATGERNVDPRSDIYSLGCVLYELLAGQPPFAAATAQAVIASILTETPRRVTELRRTVPPHVASVIERALEKLPADRFGSAREFLDALVRKDFAYVAESGTPTSVRSASAPRAVIALSVALLAATALAALAWMGRSSPEPPGLLTRTALLSPEGFQWRAWSVMKVSPTDEHLAIVGGPDDAPGLWVRHISETDFRHISDTESARGVTFSPDGRELLVSMADEIVRMGVDGNDRRVVARLGEDGAALPASLVWGDGGSIYYLWIQGQRTTIRRVSAGGGQPEEVGPPSEAPVLYQSLDVLPEGDTVLVGAADLFTGEQSVHLVDALSRDTTTLLKDARAPRWVETGHIVFVDGRGVLRAATFDLGDRAAGQPIQLGEGVSATSLGDRVAISRRGTLVYSVGAAFDLAEVGSERSDIFLAGPAGDTTWLRQGGMMIRPLWSPDGRYLAYAAGPRLDALGVYVYDTERDLPPRQVATDVALALDPVWSPDGRSIAMVAGEDFGSTAPRIAEVFGARSAPVTSIGVVGTGTLSPVAWREDGILWVKVRGEGAGIYRQPDLAEPPELWLEVMTSSVGLAPQGDYVVYQSMPEGLIVRAYPELGPPISVGPAADDVRWSVDGDAIYYSDRGAVPQLHRVEVTRDPTFAIGRHEAVMRLGPNSGWDLNPDGKRIAVAVRSEASDPGDENAAAATSPRGQVTPDRTWIVFNWFERVQQAFTGEAVR